MKLKLTAPHFIGDRLLEADTVIGDDTSFPFKDANGEYLPASSSMIGLDAEGIAHCTGVPVASIDEALPVTDKKPKINKL